MAGRTDGLIKSFIAGAAIPRRRIVKFGANDQQVVLGAAATDALIGITTEIDADSGERTDVILTDLAEVTYGGNVTRGDPLTSDATGRAVVAAPAAGARARIVGFAMVSGVSGDVGVCRIAPGFISGPPA